MKTTKIDMTKNELEALVGQIAELIHAEPELGDTIEFSYGDGFELLLEIVCPECRGTGEILVDEPVNPEPGAPLAPVGKAKCSCTI